MIIIEEKAMLPPPPPYARVAAPPLPPPPFPSSDHTAATIRSLPPSIMLRIVNVVFGGGKVEKQRKSLYWLTTNLRLVNRAFYAACMHVLRSTYLPSYTALVKPPYTSDPFPIASRAVSASSSEPSSPVALTTFAQAPNQTVLRETRVLDLFIALKVREDVWMDESELHLERDESFKDVFDLMQPRARVEDLVRIAGVREGIISIAGASSTSKSAFRPIPFALLSASFSPRRVGLTLTTKERKKTIVEAERSRDELLEVTVKKLVRELKVWLASNYAPI